MPTVSVNLDTDIYVQVNTSLGQIVLQSLRDSIRITLSSDRPVKNNPVFHTLEGGDAPLTLNAIDTNVWALALTKRASLIASEIAPAAVSNSDSYLINVKRGLVPGHRVIHKFGHGVVGTTPTPVTNSGIWSTPTSPTSLEFVSDNAADAQGGVGATKIVIQGIDVDWNEVSEEIETDGLTPVAIPTSLMRLHRWYVSESGTYAGPTAASHVGTLTIRGSGGGATWDTISGTLPFAAQSEIGVANIPTGHTAFLLSKNVFADTSKVADVYLLQRPYSDDTVSPYQGARRIIERDVGVSGGYSIKFAAPKGPFIGPLDIGFMAKVSVGTADISVDFELLIIEDGY